MQRGPLYHPLDKLINDDSLILMEAIVPFVDSDLRKPLVLYIKVTELKLIMNSLENTDYVHKCGFDRDIKNQDEVLSSLSECGFSDIANQMKNMKQAMDIMNMYNATDMNNCDIKNNYKDIFDIYDQENDSIQNSDNEQYQKNTMSNIMELLHEYDNEHRKEYE